MIVSQLALNLNIGKGRLHITFNLQRSKMEHCGAEVVNGFRVRAVETDHINQMFWSSFLTNIGKWFLSLETFPYMLFSTIFYNFSTAVKSSAYNAGWGTLDAASII